MFEHRNKATRVCLEQSETVLECGETSDWSDLCIRAHTREFSGTALVSSCEDHTTCAGGQAVTISGRAGEFDSRDLGSEVMLARSGGESSGRRNAGVSDFPTPSLSAPVLTGAGSGQSSVGRRGIWTKQCWYVRLSNLDA